MLRDLKVVLTGLKTWCFAVSEAQGESVCLIWSAFVSFYAGYTAKPC